MIFVTVGSMFPFNRIVRAMDSWASRHPEEHVLAQIGDGEYEPRHMDWIRKTSPSEFRTNVLSASIVVSHAGMGTIITAAELGRTIVLLPRRVALGEHTTDHQYDTANRLKDKSGIFVVLLSRTSIVQSLKPTLVERGANGASQSQRLSV